jgi:hypothetical protein
MDTQRAIIFQGGGGLGAYEAGVTKALYDKLSELENDRNRPLFSVYHLFQLSTFSIASTHNRSFHQSNSFPRQIRNLSQFLLILSPPQLA